MRALTAPLWLSLLAACAASACQGASEPMLPRPGATLPSIEGVTLEGSAVKLASLRGHTVLLNFWSYH